MVDDVKGVCAACKLPEGAVADGRDLGPLVTAEGKGPVAFVHRGCCAAYSTIRAGAPAPLTAQAHSAGLVHVFVDRDHDGVWTSACGAAGASRARIEDSVFVDGHPSCCPGCKGALARSGSFVVGKVVS
jgi:hypothetical protein